MTTRNAVSQLSAGSARRTPSSMTAFTPLGATAWFEIMRESGRFIARRLEEDLKAQQALLASRTAEDIMRVQADYYRTAMEQYTAESGRMMGIIFGAMSESSERSRSAFARRYDDVPL